MSGRIAAYQEGYTDGFNDAKKKYAPKRGKWKIKSDGMHQKRHCNKCKYSEKIIVGVAYNYCPNCGADMRGKKNET